MKTGRSLLILSIVSCLAPAPAAADWLVTPFVGVKFAGDTTFVNLELAADRGTISFGGTVTLLGAGVFGVEADFGYIPQFFGRDDKEPLINKSSVTTLMAHLVVAAPRRWTDYSLRPFVSVGMGLLRPTIRDVLDVFPVTSNLVGFDIGGGVIGFFTDRRGLRLEVRHFRSLTADNQAPSIGTTHLSFWRASAGLILRY